MIDDLVGGLLEGAAELGGTVVSGAVELAGEAAEMVFDFAGEMLDASGGEAEEESRRQTRREEGNVPL